MSHVSLDIDFKKYKSFLFLAVARSFWSTSNFRIHLDFNYSASLKREVQLNPMNVKLLIITVKHFPRIRKRTEQKTLSQGCIKRTPSNIE